MVDRTESPVMNSTLYNSNGKFTLLMVKSTVVRSWAIASPSKMKNSSCSEATAVSAEIFTTRLSPRASKQEHKQIRIIES